MMHDQPTQLPPFDALVITRLLVAPAKGEAPTRIAKDLGSLVPSHGLAERVEEVIEGLVTSGTVERVWGKTKKAAPKIVLTAEGWCAGLAFLGLEKLPPKTTWAVVKKVYLPGRVLGLELADFGVRKAVGSDATFKAALFKKTFNLPIGVLPKPAEALDALAWKLMGFEGKSEKLTLKALKTALFHRALGDARPTDFARAAGQLLARRVGAIRDHPGEFREALLRAWLEAKPAMAVAELDLGEFAHRVQAAASACKTGRQGSDKVFIAHVWRSLEHEPPFAAMGPDGFKQRLAQANNEGKIELRRADLAHLMNPDDLHLSAVRYLDTTFHFVKV